MARSMAIDHLGPDRNQYSSILFLPSARRDTIADLIDNRPS
jgi:hypothetical protein